MRKLLLITFLFFSPLAAIYAEDNVKFVLLQEYMFSNNNTLSSRSYSDLSNDHYTYSGKSYSLNLLGVGLQYKIIPGFDFELAFKTLFDHVSVVDEDASYMNNPIQSRYSQFEYQINSLNKISIGSNYVYKIRNNLSITPGAGINYIKAIMLQKYSSQVRYLASFLSFYSKAGIEYQLSKRSNVGVNLIYTFNKNIDFQYEGNYTPANNNIDINPISIETHLSLYF